MLEPARQFYKLPVSLNSETFKKALGFLMEHNFSFVQDSRAGQDENQVSSKQAAIYSETADPKDKQQSSKAAQLRKRQAKSDRKIAEAIEKLKRCSYQMDFYDSLAQP